MNPNSRVANSFKNLSFGIVAQLIQMLLGFVTRTIFIKYLAVEYLGINGLFTNVLSLLSLAELGVGSALLYALYKPIAEGNQKEIAALVTLSGKIYTTVAFIIAVAGLLLVPFLHEIVSNPPQKIAHDLTIIYLLFLFNTVSTYFFYYKLSLFHADQRSHVVSKSNTIVFILQNLTQICVLVYFKNFILYLAVQSVFQLSGNLVISYLVNKYYPFLNQFRNERVEENLKKEIYSNIKSTAFIKVGGLVVNNTDNLILNYFSGLIMVGLLSNYILLIGLASGLIVQVFAGMTASIANINVKESQEKKVRTFHVVNFANFWIYGLAAIVFIVLVNDFINLWIGQRFILPLSIVIALAFNFYIYGMQNAIWTYKTTHGLFKQGRMLIILTAVLNLIFSFLLGSYIGLLGILIATAIARLCTNVWYDPYIVYKMVLKLKIKDYFIKYVKYLFVLIISLAIVLGISCFFKFSLLENMILKLLLCVLIPNIMIYLFFRKEEDFKTLCKLLFGLFLKQTDR